MADETTPATGAADESPKPDPAPATETAAPETPSQAVQDGQKAPETGETAAPAAEPTAEQTAADRRKEKTRERIHALTRQREEARRAKADAEAQAARLRERLAAYETTPPNPVDFATDAEFQAAITAHEFKQLSKAERERDIEDARAQAETHSQAEQIAAKAAFDARAAVFAERAQDFHQAVNDPTLPITETMAGMIQGSEEGPAIAYYLAKNRGDAARIAQLTNPMDVAREIGAISGRISRPAPKTVTSAPPPVGAVATGSGGMGEPTVAQQVRKALYPHKLKKGA